MTLHLLPRPVDLIFVKGMFSLDSETLIVIPAQAGDGTWFAADCKESLPFLCDTTGV